MTRPAGSMSRFIVTLAAAAVVYVLAGFFIDLPPRGIHLDASDSWVRLGKDSVEVRARLKYVCTSWRPRRTDVYFPFCHDHGEGEVTDFTWDDRSLDCRVFSDGAVLSLSMSPHSTRTVEFRFRQAAPARRFDYLFGVARGWELPPNLVTLMLEAPASLRLEFSTPPGRVERQGASNLYVIPGAGEKGWTFSWD